MSSASSSGDVGSSGPGSPSGDGGDRGAAAVREQPTHTIPLTGNGNWFRCGNKEVCAKISSELGCEDVYYSEGWDRPPRRSKHPVSRFLGDLAYALLVQLSLQAATSAGAILVEIQGNVHKAKEFGFTHLISFGEYTDPDVKKLVAYRSAGYSNFVEGGVRTTIDYLTKTHPGGRFVFLMHHVLYYMVDNEGHQFYPISTLRRLLEFGKVFATHHQFPKSGGMIHEGLYTAYHNEDGGNRVSMSFPGNHEDYEHANLTAALLHGMDGVKSETREFVSKTYLTVLQGGVSAKPLIYLPNLVDVVQAEKIYNPSHVTFGFLWRESFLYDRGAVNYALAKVELVKLSGDVESVIRQHISGYLSKTAGIPSEELPALSAGSVQVALRRYKAGYRQLYVRATLIFLITFFSILLVGTVGLRRLSVLVYYGLSYLYAFQVWFITQILVGFQWVPSEVVVIRALPVQLYELLIGPFDQSWLNMIWQYIVIVVAALCGDPNLRLSSRAFSIVPVLLWSVIEEVIKIVPLGLFAIVIIEGVTRRRVLFHLVTFLLPFWAASTAHVVTNVAFHLEEMYHLRHPVHWCPFLHVTLRLRKVESSPLSSVDGIRVVDPSHAPYRYVQHKGLIYPCRPIHVHSSSGCNELCGLQTRVFGNECFPNPWVMADFCHWLLFFKWRFLDRFLPLDPIEWCGGYDRVYSIWNSPARVKPNKRKDHDFGLLQLAQPCSRWWFSRTAFVKQEIKNGFISDPRIIQDTTPMTHVIQGPFYYVYSLLMKACWDSTHHFVYASGMTGAEIGALLRPYAVYYVGDISRYDRSISPSILKTMNDSLINHFVLPLLFSKAIRAQEYTRGKTLVGRHRYLVPGQRKSGDDNTSCDNTIINIALHVYCCVMGGLSYHQICQMQFIALGDDIVIGMPGEYRDMVDLSYMRSLGFVIKPKWVDDMDRVEFCSRYFWRVGDSRVLAAKPGRALQRVGYYVNENDGTFLEKCEGLLHDNNHVPFLRVYLWHIVQPHPHRSIRILRNPRIYDADAGTWYQFEKLYGLDAHAERRYQYSLRDWDGSSAVDHDDNIHMMIDADN